MARLSRDDSSWRAQGLKARYAEIDLDGAPRNRRKRKDTRRWCKGVEGRDHVVRRRLKVPLNDRCFKSTPTASGSHPHFRVASCGHYEHHETVCVNCGMEAYRLPEAARAQVDPELARMLALEARWCGEGHLFDWVRHDRRDLTTMRARYRSWFTYEYQLCLMCGRTGRRRDVQD